MLRRLCDKGLFQNDGGLVTVKMSREEFYARQSRQYVDDSFHGSLPAFIEICIRDRKKEVLPRCLCTTIKRA